MANPGDKIKRVCKVKSIDMKAMIDYSDKSKGQYEGTELIYEQEFQGKKETKTKNFAAKSLDHSANVAMKAALQSLSKGDVFTAEFEMNDRGFWDMKQITKGGQVVDHPAKSSSPARSGGGFGPRKDTTSEDNKSGLSDYELGITCGMALNNAVAILGEGAKLAQVEKLGYEFVQMAIRFKENVRNGTFGVEEKPKVAELEKAKVVDNEIPPDAPFDDDIPF